jgi:heme-degrading monooxygenase HmoA
MKNMNSTERKQVLFDKFLIPKNSIEEFTQKMNYNRNFIKKLPGFVADEEYEQKDDEGNLSIITITQWINEISLNNAKNEVLSDYKKTGFNPSEFFQRLNVKAERGIYTKGKE